MVIARKRVCTGPGTLTAKQRRCNITVASCLALDATSRRCLRKPQRGPVLPPARSRGGEREASCLRGGRLSLSLYHSYSARDLLDSCQFLLFTRHTVTYLYPLSPSNFVPILRSTLASAIVPSTKTASLPSEPESAAKHDATTNSLILSVRHTLGPPYKSRLRASYDIRFSLLHAALASRLIRSCLYTLCFSPSNLHWRAPSL